ncbi:MAG TPA: alpha/beta fold hydrolase [Micromonosporaceae bacterium]|jgi:pimeloyl-ACP methyl ester carboxylesterase/predicted glycosyltransferase
MRARHPDGEGYLERDGVKIHYEIFGDGGPTILLLPTWTIVHKRFWKAQVPYLARHHRVVSYDGPGNGASDRPLTAHPYGFDAQVGYALAVLDATGTERAVVVGLSMAANWALQLAADHGDRVLGTVLIGPTVPLGEPNPARASAYPAGPGATLAPSRVPIGGTDPATDWVKYSPAYWSEHFEDFAWFFFGQCFPEPHSTKQIEDCVGWAGETSAAVLAAEFDVAYPSPEQVQDWCARRESPVLLVHGTDDRISPWRRSELLAEFTGGDLVLIEGGGHIPLARDPVRVNRLLHDFAERVWPGPGRRKSIDRWSRAQRRVLYLCSPIGLGHAQRDLAIARHLRALRPDVRVDWLTQHPVTAMLEQAGEHIHPASKFLTNESAHIESEAGEHDLHVFQALRRMDEILVNNFMVFHDVVRDDRYDLVIGDESWDVDHFLYENPDLKNTPYAWVTDFVGYLPMPDADDRERLVVADYNAEMINHVARYPRMRDRAIFVGDPEDIVDDAFGPDLPLIRDWTRANYDFAGYVAGFDPVALPHRDELRAELGYEHGEPVCVVTVGGSGVGSNLLHRVVASYDEAARRVPGLRMVVVAGPRIDPGSVPSRPGLEVRAYVHDLYRHLAAADLAIVQGGLTTCMELTATRRPFVYIPLRHHFEQNLHVAHRLRRHRAGRRLNYVDATPDALADAIVTEIGREVDYQPVTPDGAARAAALLAALL